MMISFEELMNSVRHQQGGAVSRKWQRQFSSQQRDRLKIGTGRVAFYVCIHLQTPLPPPSIYIGIVRKLTFQIRVDDYLPCRRVLIDCPLRFL